MKPKARWCENKKAYYSEYARIWRKKNPEKARLQDKIKREKYRKRRLEYYREYHKNYKRDELKYRARVELNNAVKLGKIKRPSKCDNCGEKGIIEGHHPNYRKSLIVKWLCTICHGKEHFPL